MVCIFFSSIIDCKKCSLCLSSSRPLSKLHLSLIVLSAHSSYDIHLTNHHQTRLMLLLSLTSFLFLFICLLSIFCLNSGFLTFILTDSGVMFTITNEACVCLTCTYNGTLSLVVFIDGDRRYILYPVLYYFKQA